MLFTRGLRIKHVLHSCSHSAFPNSRMAQQTAPRMQQSRKRLQNMQGGKSNDYLNTQGPDLAIHHADAVLDGMNE